MILTSDRANRIEASATIAVSNKATAMQRAGRNVISLAAGEPDFDTPDFIKAAAIAAIEAGITKYTEVDGTPELKLAIIAKLQRDQKLAYKPEQIIVSCGAKHSLFNLFQAILNPSDEVIIPVPTWVSYVDMVKVCDAMPVIVPTTAETRFKLAPEQLEHHITPRTKLLVIASPSNPTGMVYSQAELAALGKVLEKHPQIVIATDDIYEHIRWNSDDYHNMATACPSLFDRTVVVNGVSKAYAMTGWRIGYAAGPEVIIKTMKKLQSQSTSNPCSISQAAATAALNGDQARLKPMVAAFKKRHDLTVAGLNGIEGISCLPGDGAFYAFADVTGLMKKLGVTDDIVLATRILEEAEVATVPGSAFGQPGYIRLSFATSEENLQEALRRLAYFARCPTGNQSYV